VKQDLHAEPSSARPHRAAVRVALVSLGDPSSPTTWSGVTTGVFTALGRLGVDVRALDVSLPRGLEQALLLAAGARTRNRYDAHGAAMTRRVRSLVARRGLEGRALDGVIQIGTNFTLPPGTSYVTLEDMTLRQANSVHPVYSRMSPSVVRVYETARAAIYGQARMCTVASRWAGKSIRHDYGVAPPRIAVVGFGANHSAPPPQRDWSMPRFLFVGIEWERKGGPRLLSAFAALRERHPHAVLDVVGGHPPLAQEGVTGHGVLDQQRSADRELLAALFERATCLVVPSRVEPFGIVHVEAASVGVPSIGSSVGGPQDVLGDSGGIVVDPADGAGLLRAMLSLCDPDAARAMGEAARRRSQLYTWALVAERLLRALGLQTPDGRDLAEFL
jgi:glycosyltransferase involved in cell wall biosynthesis